MRELSRGPGVQNQYEVSRFNDSDNNKIGGPIYQSFHINSRCVCAGRFEAFC